MGSGFPLDAHTWAAPQRHSSQNPRQYAVGKRSFPGLPKKTISPHSNTESSSQAFNSRVVVVLLLAHSLPKSIWICSEFFVYARAVCQRSFRHEPTMEGEGGEVSQSFVWNRCRETVPPSLLVV
jgi:hypothetical protein